MVMYLYTDTHTQSSLICLCSITHPLSDVTLTRAQSTTQQYDPPEIFMDQLLQSDMQAHKFQCRKYQKCQAIPQVSISTPISPITFLKFGFIRVCLFCDSPHLCWVFLLLHWVISIGLMKQCATSYMYEYTYMYIYAHY